MKAEHLQAYTNDEPKPDKELSEAKFIRVPGPLTVEDLEAAWELWRRFEAKGITCGIDIFTYRGDREAVRKWVRDKGMKQRRRNDYVVWMSRGAVSGVTIFDSDRMKGEKT